MMLDYDAAEARRSLGRQGRGDLLAADCVATSEGTQICHQEILPR
jgi:hypothetical protein